MFKSKKKIANSVQSIYDRTMSELREVKMREEDEVKALEIEIGNLGDQLEAANIEKDMASKAIEGFSNLFGIKDKAHDAY
tara:strand:+ start:389 stop:628 length:240 start_codon:yes stop_codon:yes gene_type:complete